MSLKIISLNIEKDRHLDRVIPFLEQKVIAGYEVICLQEVYRKDLEKLRDSLDCNLSYFPMCRYMGTATKPENQEQGCVMLYKSQPLEIEQFCYYKDEEKLPHHTDAQAFQHAGLIIAQFKIGKQVYTIATTHFPVAPGGGTNKRQQESLEVMLHRLKTFDNLILCGDFNAPRGKEVFSKLASIYKDNIPPEITTTIDGNYHRAGHLPYVVDGFFTTNHYTVNNIEIKDGLSDHKAIIVAVSKDLQ